MDILYVHTLGSPIPAALIRFSLGWDPKQKESVFQTVPSKGRMLVYCDVTAFLEPLEARTPPSAVQETAGGFHTSSREAPVSSFSGCLRMRFDPNTLGVSHEWIIVLGLLLSGISHLWISERLSCNHARRVVKTIKRVT